MFIVRETFVAKPGQAGKLAKLFKKVFAGVPNFRVMTDMVSSYNTVVMEMQVESLAAFEKEMDDYNSGKAFDGMASEALEEMKSYQDMYVSGKREIFKITE